MLGIELGIPEAKMLGWALCNELGFSLPISDGCVLGMLLGSSETDTLG